MSLSVSVEGEVYQFTSQTAEEALRRVLSRAGVRRVDLEGWKRKEEEDAGRVASPLLAAAVHLYKDGIYSHSRPEVMTPAGGRRFAETYNDAKGAFVAVPISVDLSAGVPRHLNG